MNVCEAAWCWSILTLLFTATSASLIWLSTTYNEIHPNMTITPDSTSQHYYEDGGYYQWCARVLVQFEYNENKWIRYASVCRSDKDAAEMASINADRLNIDSWYKDRHGDIIEGVTVRMVHLFSVFASIAFVISLLGTVIILKCLLWDDYQASKVSSPPATSIIPAPLPIETKNSTSALFPFPPSSISSLSPVHSLSIHHE